MVEIDHPSSDTSSLEKFKLQENFTIAQLYSEVEAWQGTGRFQYRDEKVVDVLAAIIDAGGLMPQVDGDRKIISTTEYRPYAGVYADVHQPVGEELYFQYHDSRYWGDKIRERTLKYGRGSLHTFRPLKGLQTEINWIKKRNRHIPRNPLFFLSPYRLRSDISNNYSILIGIRNIQQETLPVPKFIGLHEKQYSQLIPLETLHIEVPQMHLEETQKYLLSRGVRIPLIAREDGERYSSQFSEESLITGNPFKPAV